MPGIMAYPSRGMELVSPVSQVDGRTLIGQCRVATCERIVSNSRWKRPLVALCRLCSASWNCEINAPRMLCPAHTRAGGCNGKLERLPCSAYTAPRAGLYSLPLNCHAHLQIRNPPHRACVNSIRSLRCPNDQHGDLPVRCGVSIET